MSSFARRLFFNAVPFGAMTAVVSMAIFGDHGLIRRHSLKVQQAEVAARIEALRRENAELERELTILNTREIGLRRMAAEELMMAPPGSTIYRFSTADQGR